MKPHTNKNIGNIQWMAHIEDLQASNAWVSTQRIAVGLGTFSNGLSAFHGCKGCLSIHFFTLLFALPDLTLLINLTLETHHVLFVSKLRLVHLLFMLILFLLFLSFKTSIPTSLIKSNAKTNECNKNSTCKA